MGICLDTEQNNDDLETTGGERTRGASAWAGRATPPNAAFPMQNNSHVKFEPPNVPVVFVLGGPGSGKVTHCDNLMQERRGVIHINMTDLLQQYAIGNDMQDFGMLSSKTVTEVLMLEMKMAPSAKTYLVSGYPRSMRDVAEYSDKIQTITGVVLVSWRQRVLERQIEYGARLGHVVLSLARMELNNFYKNVMPVADYFDQTNMLVAINGERNPEEVYKDFRAAILQILGNEDEQTVNGVSGVGVGAGGIPGEIVGVERAPTAVEPPVEVKAEEPTMLPIALPVLPPVLPIQTVAKTPERIVSPKPAVIKVRGNAHAPAVLWVVGGPGSNKAVLCQRAVEARDGWTHFSLGQRLRSLAESGGGPGSDASAARAALAAGELVPPALAQRLVAAAVDDAARTGDNIVIDAYPRNSDQMEEFQTKYNISPRMVLLDCSKLQLGRGRRDDSVAAFRRRLEVFRELSLPMLKSIDQQHRLVIVDGDTDSPDVQAEFTRVLHDEMDKAEVIATMPPETNNRIAPGMTSLQHFAHAMSRMGNGMANGAVRANGAVPNVPNGTLANGFAGLGNNKIKPSLNNVPRVPTVSQMTQDDVRRLYEQSSGEVNMNTHM